MKRLHVKLIKWISNKFGYKIAMLKAANGTTIIEGNIELLRYVDISGYIFKKELLKRNYPTSVLYPSSFVEPEPIKPLTHQQLKELGLTFEVDVTDCKNFKEASKAPTTAKEMFLAEPVPNIDNVNPIVKLTSKQLKDLQIIK